MKRFFTCFAFAACLLQSLTLFAQQRGPAAMNDFVTQLMKKMTVQEKIGQLNLVSVGFDVTGPIVSQNVDAKIRNGMVGGVFNTYTPSAVRQLQQLAVEGSRLHIPLLFGYDVIHGHRTIFPINLGMAASWDTVMIRNGARIAAREASADGLNWVFSPMVDISRDPRWGRISEGAGEDVFLGSAIARAMVRGYQGTTQGGDTSVMACVKHFALYGAAEAGRDYNTVDMSLVKMYNEYLPPYRAAIDAGAGSVMSSFNEINGVPASANKWLLTDLLRKQWGFKGLVVSDYTSVNEMISHGIGDLGKVSARALGAGLDMDMVGEGFLSTLQLSLMTKQVTVEQIDRACRDVLEAKYKLGLFGDPYRFCKDDRPAADIMTAGNRNAARAMAEHSMVLLKNDAQLLPLKPSARIALVGPLAEDQRNMLGSWSAAGDWKQAVSVATGLKNVAQGADIRYAKGCNLLEDSSIIRQLNANGGDITRDSRSPRQLIDEAVQTAQGSDVIVAVLGEAFGMTGEAACRSNPGLPDNQRDLLKALVATGKPVVLVLINGRPLTLPWEASNVSAILEAWFPGTEAGNAVGDVLFGKYNPSGKLPVTFPVSVGQVPLYYNHKSTGRPYDGKSNEKYKSRYLDVTNDPLYPFGFGLSYTHFSYGAVTLNGDTLGEKRPLIASVTIINDGAYAGEETVQLYISDLEGSITRPVEELKGFQKIYLRPGETREVNFSVTPEDLKFFNADLKYVAEPGDFQVHIGTNSRDHGTAGFSWKHGQWWGRNPFKDAK